MKYVIAIVIFCSFVGGVYQYGHHQGYAESQAEVAAQVAKANEQSRQTEQQLNQKVADLSTQLVKAKQDAQKQIAQRDADIASGKLQLYVRTKSPVCPASNASPTGGSNPATAELDPAFAQSLVAVTDDGDTAIRKLNACIATYNQVKELINGNTTTK